MSELLLLQYPTNSDVGKYGIGGDDVYAVGGDHDGDGDVYVDDDDDASYADDNVYVDDDDDDVVRQCEKRTLFCACGLLLTCCGQNLAWSFGE